MKLFAMSRAAMGSFFVLMLFNSKPVWASNASFESSGNSEEYYANLYLYAKQPLHSHTDTMGQMTMTYVDGTSEIFQKEKWDADSVAESRAANRFFIDPSASNFEAMSPTWKYQAVYQALLNGPDQLPGNLGSRADHAEQERETYRNAYQTAAKTYFSSLPEEEKQRIAQFSFDRAMKGENYGFNDRANTVELFRLASQGRLGKMQQLICERLYVAGHGFEKGDSLYRSVEKILKDVPEADLVRYESCPMDGGGRFRIFERMDILKAELKAIPVRSSGGSKKIYPPILCTREDYVYEIAAAEVHFTNSKENQEFWFRHERDACRFQASIKKLSPEHYEYKTAVGLLDEPLRPAIFFRNFADLRQKLGLTTNP